MEISIERKRVGDNGNSECKKVKIERGQVRMSREKKKIAVCNFSDMMQHSKVWPQLDGMKI